MELDKKYKMIEDYLNGTLSEEDHDYFEERLERDTRLQKEIEEHKTLMATMQLYARRQKMKAHLDQLHEEMSSAPKPKNTLWKNAWQKYFSTVAVAASVAIITVIGIAWNVNNFNTLDTKQESYYIALKKDLDKVKAAQKDIVKNTLDEDKSKKQPPRPVNSTATAFVIGSNGYLVTNYHVVKDAKAMYIYSKKEDNKLLNVEIAMVDKYKDLALLKIADTTFVGFDPLPYAFDNDVAELGQEVFTLAYPRKDLVYGHGSISSKTGFEGDTLAYQISIPVNPGNSGSPLLNDEGNLIGIISGKSTNQEGAAYAVKSAYLKQMIDEICEENPEEIISPAHNTIQYLNRVKQIQSLDDFVFELKIYSKPLKK